MYNAGYGFGNPAFNQPGTPQQQQQQQPPQQPGQPNPQMMYNQQQQFPGMGPQGGFNPGANPQMMQGMPAGMMQNPGMANIPPNGQMPGYPQQFPGGGYGQMMPGGGMPQNFAPNNYMMAGGMQGFPMNQPGMNQQQLQMMQRMQAQQAAQQAAQQQQQQQQQQHQHPQQQQQMPQQQPQHPQQAQQPPQQQQQQQPQTQPQQQPQQSHQQQMNAGMNQVSTPQRPQSAAQGTPTNPMQQQQQQQFSTPQPPSQNQTPQNAQPQSASGTPQTPTFSVNHGGGLSLPTSATPMSPAAESREKERFALLLDINHELLYESIQIQTTQTELKKENPSPTGNPSERKPTEEENLFQQDYLQCMRRLQANLSYMAALADRKPEVKVPPCPAYLSAPPLNLSLKLRAQPIGAEGQDANIDPVADRAERDQSIKDLYRRLQAVFPGFDPKKEPVFRPGQGQKAGGQGPNQASPTVPQNAQMPNMAAPPGNPGMVG